jgi:putative peptidoglycan lipid II flippase
VWLGGAIWTVAVVRQTVVALYALGDTRTPVIVSALDLVVFIGLATTLRAPLGHVGVSVAVAGSSAIQMVLLLAGLKRRIGTLCGASLSRSSIRTLLASVVASMAAWGTARSLAPRGSSAISPALVRMLPGTGGSVAFAVVFLAVAWGLGAPELDEMLNAAGRRLGRQRRAREDLR